MTGAAGVTGAEVRLESLTKAYGEMAAVDNVTATIKPGEFFTILGPSGSGKTTTMMMIAGFTYPSSGTISVGGREVANLPPQKRGLSMVFQSYAIFPHLTIFENIAFPLRVRKVPGPEIISRVEEMLELVHLKGYGNRMPRQLSGGQQQRVALARALIFKPSVLLMDEPLGALDRKLRDHMQNEIRRIHRTLNVTIIYVTHDQDEALTMSDRIAIMNRGRIEQLGTPTELYERPATKFVADFLGEQNFVDGVVVGTDPGYVRVRADNGWEFRGVPAVPLAQGARVVGAVRPEKIAVGSGAGACNIREGRVSEAVYSGDVTRYRVDAGGGLLAAKIQNRQGAATYGADEALTLVWAPEDTRVFPA